MDQAATVEIWLVAAISGGVSSAIALDLHVAALEQPLVVLFEQDGADQPGDGGLVREDADDIGAALDLLVQSFQRVSRMELGTGLPDRLQGLHHEPHVNSLHR